MSDNGWQQPGAQQRPGGQQRPGPTPPVPDGRASGRPAVPVGRGPGQGASQPPRFSVPGLGGPVAPDSGQPSPGRPGPVGPGGPLRAGYRPVVPLRPLGLGDVLGGAFTVFRRNARVLVLWGLLLSGLLGALVRVGQSLVQTGLADRAASAGTSADADLLAAGSFAGVTLLGGLLALLQFLARGFLQAPVAVDTGQRVLGRRGTFGGLWSLLAGRRLPVLWWMLLQLGAGIVLGAAFFAVAFTMLAAGSGGAGIGATIAVFLIGIPLLLAVIVWLGVKFAFTVPTIVLEGLGPIAAAAQSWRLTRGAWWRTFGILLLVQVMFSVAVGIASVPLSIATSFASGIFDPLSTGSGGAAPQENWSAGAVIGLVVGGVLIAAVTSVTDVLTASITTFLAIDRRIRTEGLDQRIAAHLDTGQPADPYAPAPHGAGPTPQRPWGQQPWPQQPRQPQWQAQQQPAPQWPAQQQGAPQWQQQPGGQQADRSAPATPHWRATPEQGRAPQTPQWREQPGPGDQDGQDRTPPSGEGR